MFGAAANGAARRRRRSSSSSIEIYGSVRQPRHQRRQRHQCQVGELSDSRFKPSVVVVVVVVGDDDDDVNFSGFGRPHVNLVREKMSFP